MNRADTSSQIESYITGSFCCPYASWWFMIVSYCLSSDRQEQIYLHMLKTEFKTQGNQ